MFGVYRVGETGRIFPTSYSEMLRICLTLLLALTAFAQKPVFPPGVKPVGPYSPGVWAGDYLYVSGQGARDLKGQMPATFDAQLKQTLENVKGVVTAAGLTMDHVVYTQVFLADIKNYDAVNRIWPSYFKTHPARSTLAVTAMPTGTPIEISAVAIRDSKKRKNLPDPRRTMPVPVAPGVDVGDRVFLSGGLARDIKTGQVPQDPKAQVKLLVEQAEVVLKQANLALRHLVYVNIYVTPQMPLKILAEALDEFIPDETARTIIQTVALPFNVHLQMTGVASRDIKRYGTCAGIANTVYCSARTGTIRQALESLKADLEVNKLSLENVVAANVYMDDIAEFAGMNSVYTKYFPKVAPARTTVQPSKVVPELSLPPGTDVARRPDSSPRAQVTVIAFR